MILCTPYLTLKWTVLQSVDLVRKVHSRRNIGLHAKNVDQNLSCLDHTRLG
jgi:hypothetical protein